ncbi:uncharacterized protein [Onthophagus taurus]|uniref:uncharacterized protein n=1 Tax=Onthophagus taurus TaxID=166361 RepID=UPI0039BE2268
MYVEHSYKKSLNNLYRDTVQRRCLMKREILQNRLLMAPLAPNAVSTLLNNHPGYVLQCIPKVVQIRRVPKCYNELPVTDNSNETYFMAPLTHILSKMGEEVDCNVATLPMFQLEDKWVSMGPHPILQNPPEKLEVKEEVVFKFTPLYTFGAAGLYTQEDLVQAQDAIRFGIERNAIQSILIRRLQGKDTHGSNIDVVNLFNPSELRKFAKSTLSYLWGWFTEVGMAISGFIGIIVLFRFLKGLASVILNGYALYRTMGCGLIILASLWNNLTMWLLNKHRPQANNPDPEVPLIPIPEDASPTIPNAPSEPQTIAPKKTFYPSVTEIPTWMRPSTSTE